jgi:hypothetical protein
MAALPPAIHRLADSRRRALIDHGKNVLIVFPAILDPIHELFDKINTQTANVTFINIQRDIGIIG